MPCTRLSERPTDILVVLFQTHMHSQKEFLRRLGGQQTTHQICLKLLKLMFMAMNYYQEKEKLKYSVFSISGFFSFILYRLFV